MSNQSSIGVGDKVSYLLDNVKAQILGKKQLVIPLFFKDYPVEESNNLVIIKNSLFDTTADHCNIKMQDNVLDISTNTTNCFIDNKILNNTISFPTVKYITFPLAVTIGPLLDSQSSKRQRSSRSPTPTGSNSLSSLYNYDLTQNYSSTVSNSIQSCSMQFQIRHHHSLPIRSKNNGRTFTIYLFLLAQIKLLLDSRTITTKRDLYYKNVSLFGSQSVVDKAITIIASSLNVHRRQLNIVASPKSCVFGNLSVLGDDGQVIELSGVFYFEK